MNSLYTADGDEILIEEYQKRDNLWNIRHPNYKDKAHINVSWQEIADVMGSTIKECKHRMRHLRGRYSRMKNNRLRYNGQLTESSWALFWKMDFLKDVVMPRHTIRSSDAANDDASLPPMDAVHSDDDMAGSLEEGETQQISPENFPVTPVTVIEARQQTHQMNNLVTGTLTLPMIPHHPTSVISSTIQPKLESNNTGLLSTQTNVPLTTVIPNSLPLINGNSLTTTLSTTPWSQLNANQLLQIAMDSMRTTLPPSWSGLNLENWRTTPQSSQLQNDDLRPLNLHNKDKEEVENGASRIGNSMECSLAPSSHTPPRATTTTLVDDMDEDELFIRSVGKCLKRIGGRKKALLKIQIQQLLYESEFHEGIKIPSGLESSLSNIS